MKNIYPWTEVVFPKQTPRDNLRMVVQGNKAAVELIQGKRLSPLMPLFECFIDVQHWY